MSVGSRLAAALLGAAAFAAVIAPGAHAQDLTATPATLSSVFASAQAGDRILLASGDYGTFAGGLKTGMVTLTPAPGAAASMALEFNPASNITIDGLTITDAYIADPRTNNLTIENSTFDRSQLVIHTGDLSNANILLDHNLHVGFDKCPTCAEGRVELMDRNADPSGVTIENSLFAGGNSDGIQNGGNGVHILNNEFAYINQVDQDPSGVHADAIQLFDSSHTVITGNYFHDDADAIMAADGADSEDIENNVIGPTDNPVAVTLYSDNASTFTHNTVWDVGCSVDAFCGIVSLGSKAGAPQGHDTTVTNNIAGDVSVSEGTATFAYLGYDFNMLGFGDLLPGTNNFTGTPTFTGGDVPSGVNGYALADGSAGQASAGDGKDVGATGLPWTWNPGPATTADPPTIDSHPDLTLEATSPDGRVADYTPPAAKDPSGAPLTPSCEPAPGAMIPIDDPDPMTVTCIATASGRIAVTRFKVSIVDTTPPAITVPAAIKAEATGPDGAVVTFPAPTATDLVDGAVAPACLPASPASGSTFPFGTTTITCHASDSRGNTATKAFTVTVADTTPPVLSGMPADVHVTAPTAAGTKVSYATPTALDLVDGARPVTCAPASGSTFPVGATVVTCQSADRAGNVARRHFTVTVAGPPTPTATPTPTPTPTPVPAGTPSVVSVKAVGKALRVRLACPAGTSGCSAVTVRLTVNRRIVHRKLKGGTTVVGKTAAASIPAGATVTVTVKLNPAGRALLKRLGRMKVTVRVASGASVVATRRVSVRQK